MPGGVESISPLVCGIFVELPYTLPQDHTLYVALGKEGVCNWHHKLEYIAPHSGMAFMLTHPDYRTSRKYLHLFRDFLAHVQQTVAYWHALPREEAHGWRQGERSTIEVDRKGDLSIQGPAQRTGIGAVVTVEDQHLAMRRASTSCRVSRQDSQPGWVEFVVKGLETTERPVYPGGIFAQPHVRTVAERLPACLDSRQAAFWRTEPRPIRM